MILLHRTTRAIVGVTVILIAKYCNAASPVQQSTTGNCSPNFANINGNVVVNISCPGLSKGKR